MHALFHEKSNVYFLLLLISSYPHELDLPKKAFYCSIELHYNSTLVSNPGTCSLINLNACQIKLKAWSSLFKKRKKTLLTGMM